MEREERYPSRKRNTPKHLEDYSHVVREEDEEIRSDEYLFLCRFNDIPKTYKQAIKGEDSEKWKAAMKAEMESLAENDTYSIIPLPSGKKVVGSRWVYSLKLDPEGIITHKGILMANGSRDLTVLKLSHQHQK